MDVSFGPDEQILWPTSVLAGVAMGFSTFHALAAAAVSFYLLVLSDLFTESAPSHSAIVDRKSWLSDAMFGVSLGYFLTDLAMILWYFPRLGGKEYVSKYLDLAGRKGSKLYLYNGVALLVGWLVRSAFPLGFYSMLTVPPVLSLMNLLWFCKICKGAVKTLCKAKQSASVKMD
ncbi:hypothetical protein HU200_024155 [Digitaria exilis]|uniref:TLC domain-containing protein n=1 Tax=Digitaria exilis TaxID=1010633 RepID=A0A835CB97_9POAL|nr:hypothetical protein HU200_024155 [Digitaria exilis]